MPMGNGNGYCSTAQRGGTCRDSKCSKSHDIIRCKPCDCFLPSPSLEQHQSGQRHRRNVASKALRNTSTSRIPPSPSLQSTSSSSNLLTPKHTSPLPAGNTSTSDSASLARVNGSTSSVGGRRPMVAYCATSLQGDTCTDSRCTYSHDILRCEPCGRSFPASLFEGHQNGKQHLQKVASNGVIGPSTSRQPHPSQSLPQDPPPTPSTISSSPSDDPPASTTTVNSGITVSHEEGVDFDVEGTGTASNPSFPCIKHTILIVNHTALPSLSIQSLTLSPSPSPCFVASLLGRTMLIQKNSPRNILVSFNALQAGTQHATLTITFRDKSRQSDQEFTVTRELRGRASLPGNNGEPPDTMEDGTVEGEDTGITVSSDPGLEFSVEYSRFGEPYATQTKELIITKSSNSPMVSFTAANVHSSDDFVTDSFSARLEGNSRRIMPNQMHIVTVSFKPCLEGHYETTLDLTFHDHKRITDFVIKRTLTGWAKPPPSAQTHQNGSTPESGSQKMNGWTSEHASVPAGENEVYLDSDGTGIVVSDANGLDFGIVDRKRPNGLFASQSSLLTIRLEDGFPTVTFIKHRTRTLDGSDPEFEAVFEGNSQNIKPGTERALRVTFSPKFEGVFKATLELVFYHRQLSAWFAVRRTLQGIAGSLEDHKHLESLSQGNDNPVGSSLGAPSRKTILLLSPDQHRGSRNLPDYEVPPIVQEVVDESTATHPYDEKALDLVATLRPESLTMITYVQYFKSLTNVEDGHQQWDILCRPPYTVEVQVLAQRYSVEIENNDEDLLPEVVLGDLLWLDDIQDNIRYEARVTNTSVFMRRHLAVLKMSLRLPAGFDFYLGARFALRFRHNRITLRRQYHALIASFSPSRRLLFPSVSDIKPMRTLSRAEISDLKSRQLVNRNIRDDDQQLQAVVSILEQSQGSVPFIVYGLPGTGKTSVVVESIVQLVRRDAGVRVLACTPSEVGTDFLVERLVAAGLDSDKLFHLNVPSRCEDISDDPRTLSLMPGYERLLAFRVVVSTCSSANVLQTLNVPRGHFSHVVIDEAAQAEEPLAMIPIMTFANAHTNVILAGDPNQFGPAIQSPIASSAGLRMSYLDRLMLMHEVYGPDTQAGRTIVELLRNRRSHPSIIAWSNRYFYEDRMREYANTYITYDLVHSDLLPKKGLPVVFHGVRGSEEHTKWSPSSFNILEASIVRDYCVKLTADPERKIYPEEIGVLALYKAQVRAIRELLRVAGLSDIAVGSIEQFQGQERKVIILASTRNEESHPRKGLGFVVNRRYMNVAITRAQALLIVIGDPEVLGKDELWRTFLEYINSREGWTGKVHKWDAAESGSVPGYVVESRKGSVLYGEEFMGRKSEKIYRSSESNGG